MIPKTNIKLSLSSSLSLWSLVSSYTDRVLSNLLAVKGGLCGRPLEVKINNVLFAGYPVQLHSYKAPEAHKREAPTMITFSVVFALRVSTGGRFKNTYELLNLIALKFSPVNKIHFFQCMGKIFCVEFQMYPLKFHAKYLTHTLKDMILIQHWHFKSS